MAVKTLMEKAEKAYQEHQEESREKIKEILEHLRNTLKKSLETIFQDPHLAYTEIEIENDSIICFTIDGSPQLYASPDVGSIIKIRMRKQCPLCEAQIWSYPLGDLRSFGQTLHDERWEAHECPTKTAHQTGNATLDALAALLDRLDIPSNLPV